jgi:hypothetical protein
MPQQQPSLSTTPTESERKTRFSWQDSLAVAGVLVGLAALLELPKFVRVVFISLAGICIATSLAFHPRWPRRARISSSISALCFFGISAFYVAIALTPDRPKLVPYLDQISLVQHEAANGTPEVHVIAVADISNQGAESKVYRGQLELITPDKKHYPVRLVEPPENIVFERFSNDPERIVYGRDDDLFKKTSEAPIPRNGNAIGVVYGVIANALVPQFTTPKTTKFRLTVEDVFERRSVTEDTFNQLDGLDTFLKKFHGIGKQPGQAH